MPDHPICWNEHELDTRDELIKFFTRSLSRQLLKVNSAFEFIRIETPILANGALRSETAMAAHETSRILLASKAEVKRRLPFVVWQHGPVFLMDDMRRLWFNRIETHVLAYNVLFSKTTATSYRPIIIKTCMTMIEKQCGNLLATNSGIVSTLTGASLARITEQNFWGGRDIEIQMDLWSCTKASIVYEEQITTSTDGLTQQDKDVN